MSKKDIVRRLETCNFQIEVTGQKNYEMTLRALGNTKITFLPPLKAEPRVQTNGKMIFDTISSHVVKVNTNKKDGNK